MFDITQIKSALKNRSLNDDMKYINEVLSDVIYAEEFNEDVIDIDLPNYRGEIEALKKDYHVHENMSVLNKITNEMVDSWNSASPSKLSHLVNDSGFVTKENIEDIINKLTGDILNRVILTSENGKSFILTADSNNKLITVATHVENPTRCKIILTSPNRHEFVLKVNDDGSLVTARIL